MTNRRIIKKKAIREAQKIRNVIKTDFDNFTLTTEKRRWLPPLIDDKASWAEDCFNKLNKIKTMTKTVNTICNPKIISFMTKIF